MLNMCKISYLAPQFSYSTTFKTCTVDIIKYSCRQLQERSGSTSEIRTKLKLTLAISNYCTIPVFITHNYMSFDLSYCKSVDNIADNTKWIDWLDRLHINCILQAYIHLQVKLVILSYDHSVTVTEIQQLQCPLMCIIKYNCTYLIVSIVY